MTTTLTEKQLLRRFTGQKDISEAYSSMFEKAKEDTEKKDIKDEVKEEEKTED